MLTRAIDNLVGVFSPRAQVNRLAAREALAKIKIRSQMYYGAKTTTLTGDWAPVDSSVNTVIGNSSALLRTRTRQLVRDMPAMATAIDRLEEAIVGSGITTQARVKDPVTGKLDKKTNQRIEDFLAAWFDNADASGHLHFTEMQQLSCRQEVEVGEYLFIKRLALSGKAFLPFQLLQFEPDALSASGVAAGVNDIHQGVEYLPPTGQAMAYHFEDPQRFQRSIRIPSDQVVHGFRTLRPGQLRGVTPLAPVVIISHQLRDYLEANLATAQKASRWLAFVTSQDPAATMAAFGAMANPKYVDSSGNTANTIDFGHAIVDFLRTGESVEIANHNLPGDSFGPFVKFMLQTFAATVGVSYELVSGDYYDAKYTAARLSRNDMHRSLAVRRSRLVRQFCEPARREAIHWGVITGRLDLPGYRKDPEHYLRHVWLDPGTLPLDPQREGRAEIDSVANKLRSPQEILIGKGRDPEQVLDEIAEWQDLAAERGIILPDAGIQPLKSNPAEVAKQQSGGQANA